MSDLALAERIEELYREGRTGVLVTVLASSNSRSVGSRLLAAAGPSGAFEWVESSGMIDQSQQDPHSLQPLLETCHVLAQSESVTTTQIKRPLVGPDDLLSLELIHGEPDLIICGAGHVGQALAPIARLLDMSVVVIDDREEYLNRQIFPDPGVRLVVEPYEVGLQKQPIRPSSSIVIVSLAHTHDERCLRVVLDSPARYIGMIGSPRRVLTVFRKLEEGGCPPEQLARVRAPIGLNIGARSPAEIAVSILAEVIMAKYGGSGLPKSNERKLIDRLSRS